MEKNMETKYCILGPTLNLSLQFISHVPFDSRLSFSKIQVPACYPDSPTPELVTRETLIGFS